MIVLVPIDGTEQSLYTLERAAQFLDKEFCSLHLFMVQVPISPEIPWELEDSKETESYLARAKAKAESLGFKVDKTDYTTSYKPANIICNYAEAIAAQLIVMGSHGHKCITQFFIGSVSEEVFKEATQPVIIVRNDKLHSAKISHFDISSLHQIIH